MIHTSLNISIPTCKKFGFDVDKISRGYIVGKAVFIDVKEYSTDEEYLRDSDKHLGSKEGLEEFGWVGKKKYGFMLEGVQRLEPVKFKGELNFFETWLKIVDGNVVKDNSQK